MNLKFWEKRGMGATSSLTTLNDGRFLLGSNNADIPAVHSATQLISGSIASAPLNIYLKNGEFVERSKLNKLLDEPMAGVSGQYWKRMLVMDILYYGNAFCEIVGSLNDIKELRYMKYSSCSVMVDVTTGKPLYYNITPSDGGKIRKLPYDSVLHFRGVPDVAISPFIGKNVLSRYAQTLQYDAELRNKSLTWLKNMVKPSIIFSSDMNLKPETLKDYRESIERIAGGADFGKTIALGKGATISTLSFKGSLVDGEVSVLKQANASDIYNLFGLDYAILHSENSKYASFQQLQASMLKTCFNAIMVSIEAELNVKLLLSDSFEFRFDRSGFIKGDPEAYSSMILAQYEKGIIDDATARKKLGYPPSMKMIKKGAVNE